MGSDVCFGNSPEDDQVLAELGCRSADDEGEFVEGIFIFSDSCLDSDARLRRSVMSTSWRWVPAKEVASPNGLNWDGSVGFLEVMAPVMRALLRLGVVLQRMLSLLRHRSRSS